MAPKNPSPAAVDDESSGTEDEQQKPQQQLPKIAFAKPNNQDEEGDDDEEEYESDDETGSDEKDNTNKKTKAEKKSKKSAAAPSSAPIIPASSRKKPNPVTTDPNGRETKKRKSFERIWSDDAEKKLLKGIIDISSRRGSKRSISNPDMDELHEYLTNSFNGVQFTKAQLVNKIRKLKDKFRSNSVKNSGSPNFTNPIDHNVYELSKKIWGSQENDNSTSEVAAPQSPSDKPDVHLKVPKNPRNDMISANSADASASTVEVELAYPMIWEALTSTGTRMLTHGEAKRLLNKIDNGKSAMLEEKFRKYHKLELQNHLRWLELMKQVTKLSCEAVDKSD